MSDHVRATRPRNVGCSAALQLGSTRPDADVHSLKWEKLLGNAIRAVSNNRSVSFFIPPTKNEVDTPTTTTTTTV